MAHEDVAGVQVYRRQVDNLLDRAAQVKPDKQIEPPLSEAHLGEPTWQLSSEDQEATGHLNQQTRLAAVEIVFREKFYRVLASTSIDNPAFIQIWNLLDIVSIFSDNEQCEPGLIFWLIEELLDSQTIDGCRKVFDYLESRRERHTKKHFGKKQLVILRSCNELLRRLSRAEDTVFCGRVFIYLFQSFPLGDKSSVNLRGEFHSDNVTMFDQIAKDAAGTPDQDTSMAEGTENATPVHSETQAETPSDQTPKLPSVVVSTGDRKKSQDVDLDALYPLFWGLQAFFSAPSEVFDPKRFATFKAGLEATLSAFKDINTEMDNHNSSRASENAPKSSSCKRTADGTELATSFNPKYLTSRDLFDLEVSDTAFRRHVLVQALILLDFILSLTPKAKTRLANTTNKSVLYGFTLNEEDTKWAIKTRKNIEGYLQQGPEGKFYYRMVDTVLSRDKNWARWKAEGCPLIERPAISPKEYTQYRENATKTYANKRLRPSPMGSLDLKFLSDGESSANIERLKESTRYSVPSADSFMKGIMNDEMDIDMAMDENDKAMAEGAKASKSWRILRLTAKHKLAAFDKIDGNNLQVLFATPTTNQEHSEHHSGDPKDGPQSLDGSQDLSTESKNIEEPKDSVDIPQPAEADGETEPQETSKTDSVPAEQSEDTHTTAPEVPSATDGDQEMQDVNKDATAEPPQDPSASTDEAVAASSASKETKEDAT